MRVSRLAMAEAMARLSSVEPSSTTMASQSVKVWARMPARVSARVGAALKQGMTMVNSGMGAGSCWGWAGGGPRRGSWRSVYEVLPS